MYKEEKLLTKTKWKLNKIINKFNMLVKKVLILNKSNKKTKR